MVDVDWMLMLLVSPADPLAYSDLPSDALQSDTT